VFILNAPGLRRKTVPGGLNAAPHGATEWTSASCLARRLPAAAARVLRVVRPASSSLPSSHPPSRAARAEARARPHLVRQACSTPASSSARPTRSRRSAAASCSPSRPWSCLPPSRRSPRRSTSASTTSAASRTAISSTPSPARLGSAYARSLTARAGPEALASPSCRDGRLSSERLFAALTRACSQRAPTWCRRRRRPDAAALLRGPSPRHRRRRHDHREPQPGEPDNGFKMMRGQGLVLRRRHPAPGRLARGRRGLAASPTGELRSKTCPTRTSPTSAPRAASRTRTCASWSTRATAPRARSACRTLQRPRLRARGALLRHRRPLPQPPPRSHVPKNVETCRQRVLESGAKPRHRLGRRRRSARRRRREGRDRLGRQADDPLLARPARASTRARRSSAR
jgi:hypothetical protein